MAQQDRRRRLALQLNLHHLLSSFLRCFCESYGILDFPLSLHQDLLQVGLGVRCRQLDHLKVNFQVENLN